MAFKLKIDQAAYDALSDEHKALYKKADGAEHFDLDLEPGEVPDVDGLKRKNAELLEEKKAEQRRREAAELERAKKDGDVTALETSWQTRLDTEVGAERAKVTGLEAQLQALTVGRAATELAAELAVVTNGVSSAKALLPHIEKRLSMEVGQDGVAKVRVLDADGKPSAKTLDQLKDEFRADPVFAPLIQASKAGGSGADGGKGGGGAVTKAFADLSETERVALFREDPVKFKVMKAEHDKSRNTR